MKKLCTIILGLTLIGFQTQASAAGWFWDFVQDLLFGGAHVYGPILCNNACNVSADSDGMVIGQPYTGLDVLAFIKAVPPPHNDSNVGWRPQDQVIICDGSNCITVMYQASGLFLFFKKPTPDTHQYRYQPVPRAISGSGGSGSGSSTITGHYEYIDYYTNVSVGGINYGWHYDSTDVNFIIDSITFHPPLSRQNY